MPSTRLKRIRCSSITNTSSSSSSHKRHSTVIHSSKSSRSRCTNSLLSISRHTKILVTVVQMQAMPHKFNNQPPHNTRSLNNLLMASRDNRTTTQTTAHLLNTRRHHTTSSSMPIPSRLTLPRSQLTLPPLQHSRVISNPLQQHSSTTSRRRSVPSSNR